MTVELYLLRHGIAASADSGRDMDRALTAEGICGIKSVMMRAKSLGCNPYRVIASPYLRAQQSARIAADVLRCSEPIHPSTRITPDSSRPSLWQEVREIAEGSLLIVSHEPLLSAAAAWMTGETRVIIEFNPATLVRIDFDALGPEPRGRLQWKI